METLLTFRRSVRDSPINTRERAKAAEQNRKPRLIIDWEVLIDGEHRATFWSNVHHVGFELRDLLNKEIPWRDIPCVRSAWMTKAVTKAHFKHVIEVALPIIPTSGADK
jgi:hypothetical protein